MRRQPIAYVLFITVSVFSFHVPGNTQESDCLSKDLALVNGRIYTMDQQNSLAQSLLIKDKKVTAVDPQEESFNACTDIIDLEQRTVIPGLIDNHVHYIRIANRPGYDNRLLERTFTIKEALEAIRRKVETVPQGELITTIGGIRRSQWYEKRFPTRLELDYVSPMNPVYVSERGSGPGRTNTEGRNLLRELGVPVTNDGSVAEGVDTARAYEVLASNITNEDRKRQLLDVAEYALSLGLTTVMDMSGTVPGVGFIDQTDGYSFFLDLARENKHKVRTRIFFPGLDDNIELRQLRGHLNKEWLNYGPDMAKVVGIGEWSVSRNLFNQRPLGEAARLAQRLIAERGWSYHQHLHTVEEIDAHFDVWEELNQEFDLAELRWTPGHLSQITPELVQRAKTMGLGLGLHGQRFHGGTTGGPPWRMVLDSEPVALGAGSDGARINALNPWNMVYYMVTGQDISGKLINDKQQISRYEAVWLLSSYQQGWFTKEEGLLGGIGEGRFADIAVLNEDVFDPIAVSDEAIRSVSSVLTIVNGEIVYDAGVLKH
tara:strand:+ start:30203 stop:31834 length:1632 start_codon:yes stop_codon:yes gene_type:complete